MDRSLRFVVPGFVLVAWVGGFAVILGRLDVNVSNVASLVVGSIPLGYVVSLPCAIFVQARSNYARVFGGFGRAGRRGARKCSPELYKTWREVASIEFHGSARDGVKRYVTMRWTVYYTDWNCVTALAIADVFNIVFLDFEWGLLATCVSFFLGALLVCHATLAKQQAVNAEKYELGRIKRRGTDTRTVLA